MTLIFKRFKLISNLVSRLKRPLMCIYHYIKKDIYYLDFCGYFDSVRGADTRFTLDSKVILYYT